MAGSISLCLGDSPLPSALEASGQSRPLMRNDWYGKQRRQAGKGRRWLCGDRAPFFPWERQFGTNWGCIHPEKQLNADKRGATIKGFVCDKWLKEMSMFGAWSSEYHQWRITWHCNYRRERHISNIPSIALFSSLRPRCVCPILVSCTVQLFQCRILADRWRQKGLFIIPN